MIKTVEVKRLQHKVGKVPVPKIFAFSQAEIDTGQKSQYGGRRRGNTYSIWLL